MRVLAISGSLRAKSSNSAALAAAVRLAPAGMDIVIYRDLGGLPHFNPDLDHDAPPAPVIALRREVGMCQGLVLCSPEYARGVAGAMKNALDWLVGSLEFPGKPVALINASERSRDADAHMRLTLRTMSARLVEESSIVLPLLGRGLDADSIVEDPALSARLRSALAQFGDAVGLEPGGTREMP